MLAFFWAGLLALLDGGQNVLVLGLALFFAGLAAIIKPPRLGLGKWGDLASCGFVVVLLLSFLPVFYWPQPDWRIIASDSVGIQLPLSLSIQPWASLESLLCMLA
ncbi:MAG: hypothetical protein EA353_00420, partial [Puniceicoccaceae bacterium]